MLPGGDARSQKCQCLVQRTMTAATIFEPSLNYNDLNIYFYLKMRSSIYHNGITLQSKIKSSFLTRFICLQAYNDPYDLKAIAM